MFPRRLGGLLALNASTVDTLDLPALWFLSSKSTSSSISAANAKFDVKLLRTTDSDYNETELSDVLKMGENVFFKLVLETPRNDLALSPQSCYATNGIDSNVKYYLIQNRWENHVCVSKKLQFESFRIILIYLLFIY